MILDLSNLSIQNIKLLNQISVEFQYDYNRLVEQIYLKTKKNIDWMVNSLISRNPYLSKVYINICYLLLVQSVLKKNKNIKMVVVQDISLKKALCRYIKENNLQVDIVFKYNILSIIKNEIQIYINYLKTVYIFLYFWLLKDKKRQKRIHSDMNIILIDTFFLPSMFETGQYKDRYYNGLLAKLAENVFKEIYFVPTILIRKNLKKAIKIAESARENFIFKFDYLNLSDYLYALFSPLRIRRIDFNQFTFHGYNLGPLLCKDFYINITNRSSLLGILNYRFFMRLKERRISLQLVVNWFENQVINRGFNRGANEFYPETSSIGYQGFIISTEYNFYLLPTNNEIRSGVLPDEIAVVGKGLMKNITKFSKEVRVITAPAFRFNGVWEPVNTRDDEENKTVLIMLPIVLAECDEIIKLIHKASEIVKVNNVDYQIKPHPALNVAKLKSRYAYLSTNFKFVRGNFKDCVINSRVMLGNTSSTCLETIALGIPVIIIGSQSGITQNPIPDHIDKRIWRISYSAQELADSIKHFLSIGYEERLKLIEFGNRIRNEYFEPVTEQAVRKFLKIS